MEIDKKSIYYRICPNCKTEFIAEHLSRIFCPEPEKKCKSKFNNKKSQEERSVFKDHFNQAVRNFRLLDNYYSKNITEVDWYELVSKGFDHTKSTNKVTDSSGKFSIPVYFKYKIINLGNNKFKIELS